MILSLWYKGLNRKLQGHIQVYNQQTITCVIPARLNSQRFPRKILHPIAGKPLFLWVWEAAMRVSYFDQVAFAVDCKELANIIESYRIPVFLTSADCRSGTDRLIELAVNNKLCGDIWVNWQGDEPFINQKIISDLLEGWRFPECKITTLKKQIEPKDDPSLVKVVTDKNGKALYFSRALIPHCRDKESYVKFYRHIGLYAFSYKTLCQISELESSELEQCEQLEQLRWLEGGIDIQVNETKFETIGIDHPHHIDQAEQYLLANA